MTLLEIFEMADLTAEERCDVILHLMAYRTQKMLAESDRIDQPQQNRNAVFE